MADADTERRVGTTLRGKWTLTRVLGVGGMAAVYVGVHKIGRTDAIKILHPEVASSAEFRARFEREAHAVNRFHHPGAVEIRDIDVTEDGAPFLVMELLEGETLSERAKRDAVTTEDALRFADELLDVLAAAHAEGIIHRDIKPDNLFIQSNGKLKVLDFGIARVHDAKIGGHRTRTGQTIGTISYMPPEQVKGTPIDRRADIYATGATLFRVLTKRRVHEVEGEIAILMAVANQPAPPLSSVLPDASPGLCLVLDRALAHDCERRYPDARTMQDDVRALLRGEPPPHATERQLAGDSPHDMTPAPVAEEPITRMEGTRRTRSTPPVSSDANRTDPTVSALPAMPAMATRMQAPPPATISDLEEPPLSLLGNAAMSVRDPQTIPPAPRSRLTIAATVACAALLLAFLGWLATRRAATEVEKPDLPTPEATKTHSLPAKTTASATTTTPLPSAAPPLALPPAKKK